MKIAISLIDLARQGPPLPMEESRASGKVDEVVDCAVVHPCLRVGMPGHIWHHLFSTSIHGVLFFHCYGMPWRLQTTQARPDIQSVNSCD